MIGAEQVWKDGVTGKGVRIRINDDGVEESNSEFEGRFDTSSSCMEYAPRFRSQYHGTGVASVAAGGTNSDCAVGIAYEATISSCYALDNPASALSEKIDQQDISLNAYGRDACKVRRRLQSTDECPFKAIRDGETSPCDVCDFSNPAPKPSACGFAIEEHCEANFDEDQTACIEYLDLFIKNGRCRYNTLSKGEQDSIADGVANGRGGKGVIYIWSSGNTRQAGDHANFQGFINSRYTISVGAVDRKGLHAPYSVGGASLFLSAPGGSLDYEVNHVMSLVGSFCGSPEGGIGTSFAAPVVAGVVALMLEVNPTLSWRDVQGILATTSRLPGNDHNDKTVTTNTAGLKHSDLYGFGIVQAFAAVQAARNWKNYGVEEVLVGESIVLADNLIPDDPTFEMTSTITLSNKDEILVESVVVDLSLQHFSRGDLDIKLISPGGTTSLLNPGNRPENKLLDEEDTWTLVTLKPYGEETLGNWTLSISDISAGDVASCQDRDFFTFSNDTGVVDCQVVADDDLCGDELQEDEILEILQIPDENGETALSACCACGGGLRASEIDDFLRSWKIAVYGRSKTASTMESPTLAPSTAADETEVPIPSDEPSEDEGDSPPSCANTRLLAIGVVAAFFQCLCSL